MREGQRTIALEAKVLEGANVERMCHRTSASLPAPPLPPKLSFDFESACLTLREDPAIRFHGFLFEILEFSPDSCLKVESVDFSVCSA